MPYKLNMPDLRNHSGGILLVGCGGTGGFVAEGLCRLLLGWDRVKLVLVDHDRVEQGNLGRQNFYAEDLERFKAQALAQRLARLFGRPMGYSLNPFSPSLIEGQTLVIGCVDNNMARLTLARAVTSSRCWWVDSGNGDCWGQVLIGNTDLKGLKRAFDPQKEACYALPLPTIQQPELLAGKSEGTISCAQAIEQNEQSPVINQAMAAMVLEVVRKLLLGQCCWMQIYLDLDSGSLRTVNASPETVSRITGLKKQKLVGERR